ncbi:UDP-N-acetylmuramoyl-L-alanyl-D-glutamate--2,6-diaminopimelate ligase [Agitococcus lubricus]|uniref:UDP-N-acetylmuramoyl-L-alanyl-D-glutamate--2,6-diaminopimelate ligase n=1 Tax=Agitococcus lubricus TaxID=1077255 RepID=A0A2T5J0M0_9GAMM|nr:UDP-N-acetylmuramoyl-L-alanyl-D-glutamate--2,6-diaminopimelate ligase [Agitococcus lubricus]PTQ89877.1 UDP-N-acetylmuramoylalanyl-D-glutamate--2,6-diaminopimelate ligase [Agitococcus lubricus]
MPALAALWPNTPPVYQQILVSGLTANSQAVQAGDVFIALRGLKHDARQYIPQAIAQGAVAVLAHSEETDYAIAQVPVICIADLPQYLGQIAARFYQSPSQDLSVLAVTGTNGKTSCAQLFAHACDFLALKSAVLGTLGNGVIGAIQPSTHTTLDALQLQKKLADFKAAGVQVVALEASSHGLEQGRLNATCIQTAIFTNLTRDHLDYHGTMEAYQQAKALLFRWPTLQTAIFNADDPASQVFMVGLAPNVRCWTYSQHAQRDADFVALSVQPSLQGLCLTIKTPMGQVELQTRLLGRFNVSNILAVLAGLLSFSIPLTQAVDALSHVQPVRGRMQCLTNADITVVVDYAHTPDALEKVLSTLREHTHQHLWCVFGCGGDRDRGKRPIMGEIASRLADKVIITADNPRSEAVDAIIADIVTGINQPHQMVIIADREQAIRYALSHAQAGDLVLVAGKGHEDYQEIQGVRYPFDDAQIVEQLLKISAV